MPLPQRIVIVVGHVEHGEFVLRDVRDNIDGKHDIVNLMRVAEQNNVFLIPVGCRTASGGAPIGSTRNISTDEIVSMLKSLRQHENLMSDVFRSLEIIGDIQINFNWTGRAIEMVVTDSGTGLPKLQIHFRIRKYTGFGLGTRKLPTNRDRYCIEGNKQNLYLDHWEA